MGDLPRRTVVVALGRLSGAPSHALALADTSGTRAGDQVVIECREARSVGRTFLTVLTMRLLQLGAEDVLTAHAPGEDAVHVATLVEAWKHPVPAPAVVSA